MRHNLIQARKQKGYTQAKTSAFLGVTEQQYQRLEYGKSDGRTKTWEKLYELFDGTVPMNQLMQNT